MHGSRRRATYALLTMPLYLSALLGAVPIATAIIALGTSPVFAIGGTVPEPPSPTIPRPAGNPIPPLSTPASGTVH